jgi:hypothetical protein
MKTKSEVTIALNAIRRLVDTDVSDAIIEDINKKLMLLTQITGLSAEANATAKKLLHAKELEVLKEHKDSGYPPSVLNSLLKAESGEYIAMLEYADRLNSAVTHSLEGLRTVISLYKTEMQNSLVPSSQNITR